MLCWHAPYHGEAMARSSQYQPLKTADSDAEPVPARRVVSWPELFTEQQENFKLLWPMLLSQYLDRGAQQLSIMLIGHLGPQQLGAVVLATMWVNITGMSLVMGGLSGLNTLSAQAFGAQNYRRLGHLLQRTFAICVVFCFLVLVVWWFCTGPILRAVTTFGGQASADTDQTLALAITFTRVYFPVLPAMLAVQATQCFLRAQRIVRPVTVISAIGAAINFPVTWACIEYGTPTPLAAGAF